MSSRARPADCPPPSRPVAPLVPAERDAVVALCRALADPTRLEIFRLIAAQPAPLCVCDIVAHFDRQQPTVSHHLRVLREAGLVRATRRGVWMYYAADPEGLGRLARLPALVQEDAVAVG